VRKIDANFQYKTTGVERCTKEAYQGTYEGSFSVLYAQPESYDGNGRLVHSGNPTLRLQANIMTVRLAVLAKPDRATAQDAAISITAINPYTAPGVAGLAIWNIPPGRVSAML
jgi:hypothetical protein